MDIFVETHLIKELKPGVTQSMIDLIQPGIHLDLTNGYIDKILINDNSTFDSSYFFDVKEDIVSFEKSVDFTNYVVVGGAHDYEKETSWNEVYIYYLPKKDQITLTSVYPKASDIEDLYLVKLWQQIIRRPQPPTLNETSNIQLGLHYTNANVKQILDILLPGKRSQVFSWNDLHLLSPTWSAATRGNTHAYFLGVSKDMQAIPSPDIKTYLGNFRDYKFYNRGSGKYEIKTDGGFDEITGMTLEFSDKTIDAVEDIKGVFDQVTGLNTDSGKMFRLYNAAFARFPDSDGLKYWIGKYTSGENDERVVASSFIASSEFKERYGENVSNPKYVETLYTNVLGRDYDQSGYNYWLGNLNNGLETRYELLLGFAESVENKALFSEMTGFV